MKKLKNWLTVIMLITSVTVFSQTTLSGKVVDETNQPLPGASVIVKSSKIGATTDFDGNFSFDSSVNSGTLEVSFIGYESKLIAFKGKTNFGTVSLKPSAEALDEIVITQVSFAVDRKTPVAVSTIKAALIENKLGTQEFPEILKSTPGVYATKSGGGFGDGRLNLRGFNSENVAVLINGVPVNDMENGRVYWSNWAGLSDVTGAMQVQRGLGASKVAVPSIGGTINILSKTTDVVAGGNFGTSFANDGYFKVGGTVSTGLLESGFAATISASRTSGDGYVDGTEFDGANYFVNLSWQINAQHKIALTSFGAPQRHGQRQNKSLISTYRKAESGNKFNPDWGMRGGKTVHIEDNFYHKSQTSLNWYFNINEKSNLSTAIYYSNGSGGGGGTGGDSELFKTRLGGFDQPVDIDNIVEINRANGELGLGSQSYLRASRNDHVWYGMLSTYDLDLGEDFKLTAGLDLRDYTGKHFTEVTDLLGGSYVIDNSDKNNPNRAVKVGDKISYYNDGEVGWQGAFAQLEYDLDQWSAFVSLAGSNTSYKRIDYFGYLDSDPLQETDKSNFFGYSAKGGANFRIDDHHNVFANIGYFEKAPSFRAYESGQHNNVDINPDADNEKIFSMELGYGFRGEKFAANVNLYRTLWKDRFLSQRFESQAGSNFYASILGVNALHQGLEIDFTYKPLDNLSFYGMLSIGDWEWQNDLVDVPVFDENQEEVGKVDLFIKGLKVSDAAQTTAALGVDWEVMSKTNFAIDYNYFANMYADFDPNSRGKEGLPQAWKTPDYGTFDMSLRYGFLLGTLDTTLTGRLNNVFDTEYIADAADGNSSTANTALVWYGFGRTFSVSAKINF